MGLFLCLIGVTGGCATLSWYGQAVGGQVDLLSRREHIADLLADPSTDPELARRLENVLAIRRFAASELGLPESRSYRHYADLERSAAVWNVIATERYAVEPRTWCYPVAGCVAYRGFFKEQGARDEAARLAERGLDVIVAPAVAYSTLGWFDDPVLNTMLVWDEARLAGFLFHELTHELLYVPDETAFNEGYATAVERFGVERWLTEQDQETELVHWQSSEALQADWVELLLAARAELADAYAELEEESELARFKQGVFDQLRDELMALAEAEDSVWLRRWAQRPLNNADLALVATYEKAVPAFQALLHACQDDPICFHREVAELADQSAADRAEFLRSSAAE